MAKDSTDGFFLSNMSSGDFCLSKKVKILSNESNDQQFGNLGREENGRV